MFLAYSFKGPCDYFLVTRWRAAIHRASMHTNRPRWAPAVH